MKKRESTSQLSMSFDSENPLAARLREGSFLILIEHQCALQEQPFDSAVTLGAAMAKRIKDLPEIAGMSVTDRLKGEDSHDPVDTAAVLAEASGKPPVLIISGKGSDASRVRDLLARAGSCGVRNLVAVTGDRSDKHTHREGLRKVPLYAGGYMDSVDILRLARTAGGGFLMGAAVNPYKYNVVDQYLQYYKMLRKTGTGAEYLITNVGWDMKKLQELQWYMQMRDLETPVIARLKLLSVDDIGVVHEGLLPGVHVARTFAALLQRESNINANQSLAAQLHRLGLQVVGCKLLGYSGVAIAGLRDVRALDMAVSRIHEALDTYRDYADWLAAWNEFHSFIDFGPVPNAFYGFSGLLTPDRQMYDPDQCGLADYSLPVPSLADSCRAALLPALFSEKCPQPISNATRKLLCRRCACSTERLRHCYYLCPAACPKGLVYGACGGSHPDGTCEFGHAPCFFRRVLALAARNHELDRLEEGFAE